MRPAGPSNSERGSTLIELVCVLGLLALCATLAFESLAARPAQARNTAVAFAALVNTARELASVTDDDALDGSTGATIGVVRDGTHYVATLYAYRPIRGAARGPVAAANTPPLQTTTALEIVQGTHVVEPPFALFFSASGHASVRTGFTVGVDGPLALEPACNPATGIVIKFADGIADHAYALSCEMAQLDLATSGTPGTR